MSRELPPETKEAFRRLGLSQPLDVFTGALLVARLIDPAADLEAARAGVEQLAGRVTARRRAGSSALQALREVLFTEEGFTGETDSYDEPPNCSVAHVLSAHRGLPITLSIVVQEVGRRAGVALEGVGLPGHFVLGGGDLPDGVYLDPFRGGILCDAASLENRVAAIFGTERELSPEAFQPAPPRVILGRVLANLRRSYERRHRYEEALGVLDCAEALEPGDPSLGRERGLLLLKTGRPEEALRLLEQYRQVAGEDAEAVATLIAAVRERADGSAAGSSGDRKLFTLEQARSLLPSIRERTAEAVSRYVQLGGGGESGERERQSILAEWAREIAALGVEIKGPWLVDFDSGAGYYCWKYPERALEYFHGYEEGFAGRLPLQ
ncbi:MAG TPA: tetratricopeptide repeat protein [Thermoanaerobaculia bacterium]|nr:tetratricopeptide repeat protein [Thermoanaerobaculia bacterium]